MYNKMDMCRKSKIIAWFTTIILYYRSGVFIFSFARNNTAYRGTGHSLQIFNEIDVI